MDIIDKLTEETICPAVFGVAVGNIEYTIAGRMICGRKIASKGCNWREVCHNAYLGDEVLVLDQIIGTTCVRDFFVLDAIICPPAQDNSIAETGLLYQLPQICRDVYGLRPEIILYRPKVVDEKNDDCLEQKILPLRVNGYRNLPGTDYYFWIADLYSQHQQ